MRLWDVSITETLTQTAGVIVPAETAEDARFMAQEHFRDYRGKLNWTIEQREAQAYEATDISNREPDVLREMVTNHEVIRPAPE